jgi:hypothetical protein
MRSALADAINQVSNSRPQAEDARQTSQLIGETEACRR